MAKVKSFSSFKAFPTYSQNDSLGLADNFLETYDESPPKCEIALNELLNESDKCFDKQHFDNEVVKTIETPDRHMAPNQCPISYQEIDLVDFLQVDADKPSLMCIDSLTMPPTTNCEATNVSEISLSALAENHFKSDIKTKTLEVSSCYDLDLTLADLLSDVSGMSVASKPENHAGSNIFDLLSFSPTDISFTKNFETQSDEVIDSELHSWLNSCETSKYTLIDSHSDDDTMPDIDLNVCIKKTKDSKSSIVSTSPSSSDSGFDEPDFVVLKSKPFFDFPQPESICCTERGIASVLTNPKPSLFSKVISCKPCSDKMKNEKIKSIRKELFKKHFPTGFVNSATIPNPLKSDCLEDKSNHRIIEINGRFMVPIQ